VDAEPGRVVDGLEGRPHHERAMFAPLVEPPLLSGVGSRLAEVPTIPGHPFVSPYEELKLKPR